MTYHPVTKRHFLASTVAILSIFIMLCAVGTASPFQQNRYLEATEALQAHNYGAAESDLLKLHNTHPNNPRILLDLAIIASKLHQPQKLTHWQQQLNQRHPNSLETQWAESLNTGGWVSAESSQPMPAMPAIEVNSNLNNNAQPAEQHTIANDYRYEWEEPSRQTPQVPVAPSAPKAPTTYNSPTMATPYTNTQNTPQVDPALVQQMMILQMMGNTGNNQNNNGSFNPATLMMMPQMVQNNGQPGMNSGYNAGQNTINPDTMSQMMMNQMMSGMDFGFSNKDDR